MSNMNNDALGTLLDSRAQTHGTFEPKAVTIQILKETAQDTPNWAGLAADKKEAIDMIFSKVGRILHGNSSEADHWDDIAGYAKLVADRLRGVVR